MDFYENQSQINFTNMRRMDCWGRIGLREPDNFLSKFAQN